MSNYFSQNDKPSIRVLHLISSSGFFGAESVVLTLAQEFQRRGTVSIVAGIDNARNSNLEIIDRAQLAGLRCEVFKSKGRFDLQTLRDVRKFLVENKINIVHTHNYKSDSIAALATVGLNVNLIATAHGYTASDHKVAMYERLDRWVLKTFFKKIVLVDDQVMPDFVSKKRCVIANGINVRSFVTDPHMRKKIRVQYSIEKNDVLIATVGRLSVEKNQMLYLKALKEIMGASPNVKAMVIGSGPEEERLKNFVFQHGLEKKIIFTGLINNVVPYYQAMDIFVLSSITEGVPLTVLEAMASQVPVIATRVGGIGRLIENRSTGLLIDSRDVLQLRTALEFFINNPSQRQSMAQLAFEFIQKNYSLDVMIDQYNQVYKEALVC